MKKIFELHPRFLKHQEDYNAYKNSLQEKASQTRERFLNMRREDLDDGSVLFPYNLARIYSDLCFFPDPEIKTKLMDFGVPKYFLKWFCDLHLIEKEFENIRNNTTLIIFPRPHLFYIKSHLDIKIKCEICECFGLVENYDGNPEANLIYAEFDTLFRRKDYADKSDAPTRVQLFDQLILSLLSPLEELMDEKSVKKYFLDMSRGRTEKYFLRLIAADILEASAIGNDDLIKRKACSVMFDLFKMIMADQEMLSKDEFVDKPEPIYKNDYVRYQASRLEKILGLNLKNFFRLNPVHSH